MQYILKNPPPPPTVQAIQNTSWDEVEAWVEKQTGQTQAPGFEAEGKDDSVNVTTDAGIVNVLKNDAFIIFNGEGKGFSVQDAANFNAAYELDPNVSAS